MAYASPADLRACYPERDLAQLSSEDGAGIDEAVLARAIDDAGAIIDGHLATRYQLPVPEPVPPILRRIACDIALYQLLTLRPQSDIEDPRRRYEDWLKYLRDVANGGVALPVPVLGGVGTAPVGFVTEVSAARPVLGPGVWRRYGGGA